MGVPIPSVKASYFEVFDLSDLDHTLRVLGITLFVVGIITTLLGHRAWAASPAAGSCAPWPTCRGPPAPSPEASSTPASTPTRPTPTSRA